MRHWTYTALPRRHDGAAGGLDGGGVGDCGEWLRADSRSGLGFGRDGALRDEAFGFEVRVWRGDTGYASALGRPARNDDGGCGWAHAGRGGDEGDGAEPADGAVLHR